MSHKHRVPLYPHHIALDGRGALPSPLADRRRGIREIRAVTGSVDAPERAAGWIGRARRERRSDLFRSAVSWVISLAIAAIIVGSAHLLIRGIWPSNDIAELVRRVAGF
jgi:hypothetical protein